MRYPFRVLLALYALLTKQHSRLRIILFNVQRQGRTTLFVLTFFRVGSVCGLGPDLLGIHSISLAARYRIAACSTTLRQGLQKNSNCSRAHGAPFVCHFSCLGKDFLTPCMSWSTMSAFHLACQLDGEGKLETAPRKQMSQIICAGFLWTYLCTCLQNFGTDQSASRYGHSTTHETCIMCFSPWAHSWHSTHSLEWTMYSSEISQ